MELLILTNNGISSYVYEEFKFQYGATNIQKIHNKRGSDYLFKFQYGATNMGSKV